MSSPRPSVVDHPRYRDIDPELLDGLRGMIATLDSDGPADFTIAGIPAFRARVAAWLDLAGTVEPVPGVSCAIETIPTDSGDGLRVAVYRPADVLGRLPAFFHIHGGGMISGSIDTEGPAMAAVAADVGCVVISVDYRLAPEHRHPVPVEDCYTALRWAAQQADRIGIDPDRIALGGESAGGGLAAGTALLARDRGGPSLVHQQLIYPMLDDRNLTRSSREFDIGWPGWTREMNLAAWRALLGDLAGGPDVPAYAAPARATDLAGLPPTYIDCAGLEVFRDEDVEYAMRLAQAGVAVELHVWPGVFHGWEGAAQAAAVTRRATEARQGALRRALHGAAA